MDETPDEEREFYEILGTLDAREAMGMIDRIGQDFVDVTRGVQAGLSSDGNAWICLPFTQKGAMRFIYAHNALADHVCTEALVLLMLSLHTPMAHTLAEIVPQFELSARELPDPFDHG